MDMRGENVPDKNIRNLHQHGKMLKISKKMGLTMRIANALDYHEPRDALAHDWSVFMKSLFPDNLWMPLPNIGNDIVSHCKEWNLDGIILTGGNDIGTALSRDKTEKAILNYAIKEKIPVFGGAHSHFPGNIM